VRCAQALEGRSSQRNCGAVHQLLEELTALASAQERDLANLEELDDTPGGRGVLGEYLLAGRPA
jgi:hypothetical protein